MLKTSIVVLKIMKALLGYRITITRLTVGKEKLKLQDEGFE